MRFSTAFLALALLPAGLTVQAADAPKDDGHCPSCEPHVFMRRVGQSPVKLVDATYLGVITESISLQRAGDLQLPPGTGLSIVGVAPDSPAAKAGFQPGDVLCKLNDQRLVNPAQLRVLVRLIPVKDSADIQIIRHGKPQTITTHFDSHPLPELSPGGEEPRMFTPQGDGHMGLIPFSGEPMPQDMLDRLPEEFREQVERLNRQHPRATPRARADDRDDDSGTSVIIEDQAAQGPSHQADGGFHFTSKTISNDGTHTIEVTRGDDNRLRITDKTGNELYNGKIPANDKEWEKVPAEVRAKARSMAKQNRLNFRGAPADKTDQSGQSF